MDLEIADWCWQGSSAFQFWAGRPQKDQKAANELQSILSWSDLTLIDSVQMGFMQSDKQYSLLLTIHLCVFLGLALFSVSVQTFSILICSFYICHLWVILSLCGLCYFKPVFICDSEKALQQALLYWVRQTSTHRRIGVQLSVCSCNVFLWWHKRGTDEKRN